MNAPNKENEEYPNKVEKTTQYDLFKFIEGNRKINKEKVLQFKEILKKRNLLFCNPILVNISMEIIDGQHRFCAAREMNLAIYYIKADLEHDDIVVINSSQDNWEIRDYIWYFCSKENENYLLLDKFLKENEMSISLFFCFYEKKRTNIKNIICGGFFNFSNERAEKVKEKIVFIKQKINQCCLSGNEKEVYYLSCSFCFFESLSRIDEYLDFKKIVTNIFENIQKIKRCSGWKQYIMQYKTLGLFNDNQ